MTLKVGDWVGLVTTNAAGRGQIVAVVNTVFGRRYRVRWTAGLCAGEEIEVFPEAVGQWMNPPRSEADEKL
jgi:hypothetical protein